MSQRSIPPQRRCLAGTALGPDYGGPSVSAFSCAFVPGPFAVVTARCASVVARDLVRDERIGGRDARRDTFWSGSGRRLAQAARTACGRTEKGSEGAGVQGPAGGNRAGQAKQTPADLLKGHMVIGFRPAVSGDVASIGHAISDNAPEGPERITEADLLARSVISPMIRDRDLVNTALLFGNLCR